MCGSRLRSAHLLFCGVVKCKKVLCRNRLCSREVSSRSVKKCEKKCLKVLPVRKIAVPLQPQTGKRPCAWL